MKKEEKCELFFVCLIFLLNVAASSFLQMNRFVVFMVSYTIINPHDVPPVCTVCLPCCRSTHNKCVCRLLCIMMEDCWLLYLALVKQKPDRQHWIVFATLVLLSISLYMAETVCLL